MHCTIKHGETAIPRYRALEAPHRTPLPFSIVAGMLLSRHDDAVVEVSALHPPSFIPDFEGGFGMFPTTTSSPLQSHQI
jgi:hypothetical protein